MVVIALIGILAAISIPLFAEYWRSAVVRAGAQEMRTALQQAKQLAITQRQNICVLPVAGGYQFRTPTCATVPPIIMAGTDGAGTFRLQNNVTVGVVAGPPVFTPLGAAAPGGTFTVTRPGGNALNVVVSAAGRIN